LVELAGQYVQSPDRGILAPRVHQHPDGSRSRPAQ
jgi:hypothetical protein